MGSLRARPGEENVLRPKDGAPDPARSRARAGSIPWTLGIAEGFAIPSEAGLTAVRQGPCVTVFGAQGLLCAAWQPLWEIFGCFRPGVQVL